MNSVKTDLLCPVVILSSGLSERMRKPKALLMWDQETTFLEKIAGAYENAGATPIICTIHPDLAILVDSLKKVQRVRFVLNHHPEWGRLHSIQLGLAQVKDEPFCFIQNIDNPFIHEKIVRKIYSTRDPGMWCSPVFRGKSGHPVLLPQIIMEWILSKKDLDPAMTLNQILHMFPKKIIEIQEESVLQNINTQKDYHDFLNRK